MRPSRTSDRPRPLQTAWELWLVRQLSRLGIRLAPGLVVGTVAVLVGGGCLLVAAAISAWGEAAVMTVRAGPGFFGTEPPGLTNATHLVFLASIPLILRSLVTVVHAVGLWSPEPSIMRADRAIWTALGLEVRHVLLTHVAIPRIPLLVIVLTLPLVVGTLSNLTTAEQELVVILASTAVVVELVHLAANSHWLTRPLREGAHAPPRALVAIVGAVVVGVGAGLALRTIVPLLGPDASGPHPLRPLPGSSPTIPSRFWPCSRLSLQLRP